MKERWKVGGHHQSEQCCFRHCGAFTQLVFFHISWACLNLITPASHQNVIPLTALYPSHSSRLWRRERTWQTMANHGVAVLLAVLQGTALGLYAARASATRAFCPPDRLMPRAPMKAPSPPAAGLIGAPGCPVPPMKDGDRTDRTTDNWMKLGVIMTIHNIYEMDSV